jgi:hypothetical protein
MRRSGERGSVLGGGTGGRGGAGDREGAKVAGWGEWGWATGALCRPRARTRSRRDLWRDEGHVQRGGRTRGEGGGTRRMCRGAGSPPHSLATCPRDRAETRAAGSCAREDGAGRRAGAGGWAARKGGPRSQRCRVGGEVGLGPRAVFLVQGSVEASEAQKRYGRVLAHLELQGPTTARGYMSAGGGQRCAWRARGGSPWRPAAHRLQTAGPPPFSPARS